MRGGRIGQSQGTNTPRTPDPRRLGSQETVKWTIMHRMSRLHAERPLRNEMRDDRHMEHPAPSLDPFISPKRPSSFLSILSGTLIPVPSSVMASAPPPNPITIEEGWEKEILPKAILPLERILNEGLQDRQRRDLFGPREYVHIYT